jgi:hypothetical protein
MAEYNRECADPPAFFKKVLKFHPKLPIIFLGLKAPEKNQTSPAVLGSSDRMTWMSN